MGGAVTGELAAATCGMSLGATIAGSAMAGTAGYLAENIVAGKQAAKEKKASKKKYSCFFIIHSITTLVNSFIIFFYCYSAVY